MKFTKYLIAAFAAAALFTACSDDPSGVSTKVPTGSQTEDPDPAKPDNPVDPSDIQSPLPIATNATAKTTVDATAKRQVMEGFGASDCWLPAQIGQYWTGNRLQIAKLLFSKAISNGQPTGIGLSMWRVNLGAGTAEQGNASGIDANNRAESYLTDGVYNWNKCAGQRYFMQQAKNNGVESFILFSNSPLVQFTKNGKGYNSPDTWHNSNLKDDCYDAFAEYLANVAQHFESEGYNVTHISPVNEPQHAWSGETSTQEGCSWSNAQIAKLTKALDKAITAAKSSSKILIPEAAAWTDLYEGNANDTYNQIDAFFSVASSNYVGDLSNVDKVVAGHSYWSFDNWDSMRGVRNRVDNAASARGLRVWQTEWSMLDACPSELGGNYDTLSEFDIALYMSKIIHNDIVMAGCTSWSYWTAMSVERWSQKNRFELIKTTPAGGNYSDDFTAEGTIEATPNLWVLGNYSRFVRPGYTRIGLTGADSKNFFGTAYISPDNKTVVAVYTNADKDKGMLLNNTFTGLGNLKSVTRYTTSATKNMLEEPFNPADKVFVDPYSVSTVVYTFE